MTELPEDLKLECERLAEAYDDQRHGSPFFNKKNYFTAGFTAAYKLLAERIAALEAGNKKLREQILGMLEDAQFQSEKLQRYERALEHLEKNAVFMDVIEGTRFIREALGRKEGSE